MPINLLITVVPTIIGQVITSPSASFFIKVIMMVIPLNQFQTVRRDCCYYRYY